MTIAAEDSAKTGVEDALEIVTNVEVAQLEKQATQLADEDTETCQINLTLNSQARERREGQVREEDHVREEVQVPAGEEEVREEEVREEDVHVPEEVQLPADENVQEPKPDEKDSKPSAVSAVKKFREKKAKHALATVNHGKTLRPRLANGLAISEAKRAKIDAANAAKAVEKLSVEEVLRQLRDRVTTADSMLLFAPLEEDDGKVWNDLGQEMEFIELDGVIPKFLQLEKDEMEVPPEAKKNKKTLEKHCEMVIKHYQFLFDLAHDLMDNCNYYVAKINQDSHKDAAAQAKHDALLDMKENCELAVKKLEATQRKYAQLESDYSRLKEVLAGSKAKKDVEDLLCDASVIEDIGKLINEKIMSYVKVISNHNDLTGCVDILLKFMPLPEGIRSKQELIQIYGGPIKKKISDCRNCGIQRATAAAKSKFLLLLWL